MKYLLSFHNQQGMNNIIPIAEELRENILNEVALLDLSPAYSQPENNFSSLKNISLIVENSIYKNVRNLSRVNKLFFYLTKFLRINKLANHYDVYIFSPGGFFEGLISKHFIKKSKKTYFIEAGIKIYLFLSSQESLKPKKNFLKYVSGYFTTGETPRNKLVNFTNINNKIYNYGVPRYSSIVSKYNNSKPFEPKKIINLLYLTSASKYHKVGWEDAWQKEAIENLVNSSIIDQFILNIKVHPRDDLGNYKKYEKIEGVNILYGTNIEKDIVENDCIISGPSTSIHETSLLKKTYVTFWPFDNNENQYMPEISMVKTIDNLISKILKLNHDLSFQNEVYSKQLILAKQYINIDSDSSTNSIIKHIINENKERY